MKCSIIKIWIYFQNMNVYTDCSQDVGQFQFFTSLGCNHYQQRTNLKWSQSYSSKIGWKNAYKPKFGDQNLDVENTDDIRASRLHLSKFWLYFLYIHDLEKGRVLNYWNTAKVVWSNLVKFLNYWQNLGL